MSGRVLAGDTDYAKLVSLIFSDLRAKFIQHFRSIFERLQPVATIVACRRRSAPVRLTSRISYARRTLEAYIELLFIQVRRTFLLNADRRTLLDVRNFPQD